jgi:very-short-patch-repair endonuclease
VAKAKLKDRRTLAQIWLYDYLKEKYFNVLAEYKFHDGRKWKFDIAVPYMHLAFECDGGKWHGGHRRGKALEADYERQNTAIMEGWRVLRFTNEQVLDGTAKAFIERYL